MTPIMFVFEFLSNSVRNRTLLLHARRIVVKEDRIDAFRTSSVQCLYLDTIDYMIPATAGLSF